MIDAYMPRDCIVTLVLTLGVLQCVLDSPLDVLVAALKAVFLIGAATEPLGVGQRVGAPNTASSSISKNVSATTSATAKHPHTGQTCIAVGISAWHQRQTFIPPPSPAALCVLPRAAATSIAGDVRRSA